MKKEEQFPGLIYCVVLHNIRGAKEDVLERMAATCSLLLCDARKLRELLIGLPIHKPKLRADGKRTGYTRPGYIDGYKNLPVSALTSRARMSFAVLANIYGIERRVSVSII